MFGFGSKSSDASQGGASESSKEVKMKFVAPKFNLGGKEYVSSELEAAAEAKDAEALSVIEQLLNIEGCGVIEIVTPE